MPLILTHADIDQLRPLTPAEEQLLVCCKSGEPCVLGNGKLPTANTPQREVRADLLRYLILGGCKKFRVNGWGVGLNGAYISGALDLSFERARKATGLINCRFAEDVVALQTKFDMLVLNGSALHALNAQGIKVTGDVFLRNTTATGEVDLSGAQIGGQFDCDGATFAATKGHALNAQGVNVSGDVFLRDATATGEVSLSGAQIGGVLVCDGATFSAPQGHALNAEGVNVSGDVFLRDVTATGAVSLSGAQIGGGLVCDGATFAATEGHLALNLQRAEIRAGFCWRNATLREGVFSLTSAHVGDLVDDLTSWPEAGRLILDGFTYDRISAAPTDAARRLDWLAKGGIWAGEFFPQPYTQLAKVLSEMGHDADARAVLAERERLIRYHIRQDAKIIANGDIDVAIKSLWPDLLNLGRWTADVILRWVVGYGHRPFKSLLWLLAFWVCATSLSHRAWEAGDFAPNSDVIQNSSEWIAFAASDTPNPAKAWSERTPPQNGETPRAYVPGQDWATFNRYAYAADLVIPIIDLGQTDAWAPSTERGPWGWRLWAASFVLTLAGWLVTALGAAAITGIIRRD